MIYVERNHPAIVPKAMFYQVREEMTRRASKRKVLQKMGKTEQGKYSAKYALIEVLDIAGMVQQGGSSEDADPLTQRTRLDALTVRQTELLDRVQEDMDNPNLTAQLKALAGEKQDILGRLGALQQDEEQRAGQEARRKELAEWLDRQKTAFTEYEDVITRRYVEKVTVLDAETIRIKFRYTESEIDKVVRA